MRNLYLLRSERGGRESGEKERIGREGERKAGERKEEKKRGKDP